MARATRPRHADTSVWLAGPSGARKFTSAFVLERLFSNVGFCTVAIDEDELRRNFNSDLGLSREEPTEDVRRVSGAADLPAAAGSATIVPFISFFTQNHAKARRTADVPFSKVFTRGTPDLCRRREKKLVCTSSLSRNLESTGIESTCEAPENPVLVIDTCAAPIRRRTNQLFHFLRSVAPIELPRSLFT